MGAKVATLNTLFNTSTQMGFNQKMGTKAIWKNKNFVISTQDH
jgi:hypothetical protein